METSPSPELPPLRVLLAAPRGFCAGVRRAIDGVRVALERFGPPVYVRRAIVHNDGVVRALEAEGAIFVREADEAPPGAVLILSAHGVAPAVKQAAERRGLRTFDAVCPLVAKVHRGVLRHHRAGRRLVLIGHPGHPEIEGTLGQLPPGAAHVVARAEDVAALSFPRDSTVAYAVQTTFSVEEAAGLIAALGKRYPDLAGPSGSDICYATTNRQAAIRAIAPRADAVIVAGAHFSSNANRLAEVAREAGCAEVQLVDRPEAIDWAPLAAARSVGLTAAASTPETSVEEILAALRARFEVELVEEEAEPETAVFAPMRFG